MRTADWVVSRRMRAHWRCVAVRYCIRSASGVAVVVNGSGPGMPTLAAARASGSAPAAYCDKIASSPRRAFLGSYHLYSVPAVGSVFWLLCPTPHEGRRDIETSRRDISGFTGKFLNTLGWMKENLSPLAKMDRAPDRQQLTHSGSGDLRSSSSGPVIGNLGATGSYVAGTSSIRAPALG